MSGRESRPRSMHSASPASPTFPARYLSAGQRRRLALGRLLVAPAPLWLLDEPRTALDRDAVDRLDRVIAGHRAAGGLAVLAVHGGALPPAATVLDLDAASRLWTC